MGNRRWVHVGELAASQSRLERVEPVGRGVEGIKPSGVAHGGTQGQGFAAGAGTKVDHHLAALGVEQEGQQLRAFVLHFDRAPCKSVEFVQRGLALNAQAPWRVRRGFSADARERQLVLHIGALVGPFVDAQVESSGTIQRIDQGPETFPDLLLQRRNQPLRQVVTMAFEQIVGLDLPTGLEPGLLGFVERAHQKRQGVFAARLALGAVLQMLRKPEYGQATLFRARARGREVFVTQLVAQDVVERLRQQGALARAEGVGFALVAEETRHHTVGGMLERQGQANQFGARLEKGFWMHGRDCPTLLGAEGDQPILIMLRIRSCNTCLSRWVNCWMAASNDRSSGLAT